MRALLIRRVFAMTILATVLPVLIHAQISPLQKIANDVDPDSSRDHIRCLAGDSTFAIGGASYRIAGRQDSTGRKIARLYLKSKLDAFGLVGQLDTFGLATDYSIAEVNVLATQAGVIEPQITVIIGAHYDAGGSGVAPKPGAEENASGVAAVLEAARLLSRYQTRYTVVYAFWDLGESGRSGSEAYAHRSRSRGDSILGVLNIYDIGWDSVQTSRGEIWVRSFARSQALGDSILALSRRCETGVTMSVFDPALVGSDHVSFWLKGYSAVSIVGKYMEGNRNPYVGSSNDKIEHLNLGSLLGRARVSVAAIAWLGGIESNTASILSDQRPSTTELLQGFPNPFNPSTTIRYRLQNRSHVSIEIFNTLGQLVRVLQDGETDAGEHEVSFSGTDIQSGLYICRMQAGSYRGVTKLLLLR